MIDLETLSVTNKCKNIFHWWLIYSYCGVLYYESLSVCQTTLSLFLRYCVYYKHYSLKMPHLAWSVIWITFSSLWFLILPWPALQHCSLRPWRKLALSLASLWLCWEKWELEDGWGVSARTVSTPQRAYMSGHLDQPKPALIRGWLNKHSLCPSDPFSPATLLRNRPQSLQGQTAFFTEDILMSQ